MKPLFWILCGIIIAAAIVAAVIIIIKKKEDNGTEEKSVACTANLDAVVSKEVPANETTAFAAEDTAALTDAEQSRTTEEYVQWVHAQNATEASDEAVPEKNSDINIQC